jgi:hypothetical protein
LPTFGFGGGLVESIGEIEFSRIGNLGQGSNLSILAILAKIQR